MSSSLYITVEAELADLVASIAREREPSYEEESIPPVLPPFPADQLTIRVTAVWDKANPPHDVEQSSPKKQEELLRVVMDLIGKDMVVTPIANGELVEPLVDASDQAKCHFQTSLHDRLDVYLTLLEVVYAQRLRVPASLDENSKPIDTTSLLEPGAVIIPILEELVELVSVEAWRDLWTWMETRSKRYAKNMPASRGKALPFLRTVNGFLRFLPRTPADLVFRGRVHQFASSVISVADKSATNHRGDYNVINTTWEENNVQDVDGEREDSGVSDGDVQMEEGTSIAGKVEVTASGEQDNKGPASDSDEPDFYSTLWSLQHYFAYPPSLGGATIPTGSAEASDSPFQQFKDKTDFVLPKLFAETQREKELMGKEADTVGNKRKRSEGDDKAEDRGLFYPRYLTGKRLLEHELADQAFRCQILVQYFILFQFLLNLTPASAKKQTYTGGIPKSFVIEKDNEVWVKEKIGAIRDELRKMSPDGVEFEATVLSIITRERHYAQWKNDSCPEKIFDIKSIKDTENTQNVAKHAAKLWQRWLVPPKDYPHMVGTEKMSAIWTNGFTSIEQLKRWKRPKTLRQLATEVSKMEEDILDDQAMGGLISDETTEKRTILNWRALRIASHTQLRHFASLKDSRNITTLTKAIDADRVKTVQATQTASTPATPLPSNDVEADGDKSDEEDVEGLKKEAAAEIAEVKEEPEDEEVEEGGKVDDVERSGEDVKMANSEASLPEEGVTNDTPVLSGDAVGEIKEEETINASGDDERAVSEADEAETETKQGPPISADVEMAST